MKSKIGIIIGREFNERVRKKSFIITTLLTPLLMIGLMFAPMLIAMESGGDEKNIAVVDDSGIIAPYLQSSESIIYNVISQDATTARREQGDCFAVLHIGHDIMENPDNVQLYANGSSSIGLEQSITAQIEMALQNEKLKSHNIENLTQILADIETEVNIQSFKNSDDEEAESSSSVVATVLAYILSFVLYMFLLIYGAMVMQSVIEEKNSRVLEVMASSVRPFEMMMGKILGVASVAVVQIIIWAALISGIAYFVLPLVLPDEIMASISMMREGAAAQGGMPSGMIQAVLMLTDMGYILKVLASLLAFVVGGFLLYAAMFAAVGSAVDSPQDAQQLQTPITLPIILSLLVMLSVINDPTSKMAFWFSIIPFTSPIVMMARIPYGIPAWEIALSIALLYATFLIVVWFAAKIYRVGILMHGKKPTIKELWRWTRYK
jgi:ABC-2 type transport system permease protein